MAGLNGFKEAGGRSGIVGRRSRAGSRGAAIPAGNGGVAASRHAKTNTIPRRISAQAIYYYMYNNRRLSFHTVIKPFVEGRSKLHPYALQCAQNVAVKGAVVLISKKDY